MLKRTALHGAHVELGARLVAFGGWEMPIQYAGILEEHRAVRTSAGLFDISHMGEVLVSGAAGGEFLNSVLTNDVRKLVPGQGQYTLLCQEDGGVIDDLFAYRTGTVDFLLIINASRIADDVAWLIARLGGFSGRNDVDLQDASDRYSALAIQGPGVAGFVDAVFPGDPVDAASLAARPSDLKRNRISTFSYGGRPVWFARTGYTGEDGFEVVGSHEVVGELWERFLAVGRPCGLQPCGLGARDTLRMEMCYPLYGQELTTGTTPMEAGLETFVALDKPEFCGQAVLRTQKRDGVNRRLAAFRASGVMPPPRAHYSIWAADAGDGGSPLGESTSGTLSPSLGVGIGMAYLPPDRAVPGQALSLDVRGRKYPIEVVPKPIYRRVTAGTSKPV